MKNTIRFIVTLLGIAFLSLTATAGATDVAGLTEATGKMCDVLKNVEKSTFVGFIAIAMFFGGLFMIWLKMRGGLAMSAFGLVGYFVVRNATTLASNFGLSACK